MMMTAPYVQHEPGYLTEEWFAARTADDLDRVLFAIRQSITDITAKLSDPRIVEDRGEVWAAKARTARQHRFNEEKLLMRRQARIRADEERAERARRHQEMQSAAKAQAMEYRRKRLKLGQIREKVEKERKTTRHGYFVAAAQEILPPGEFDAIWCRAEKINPADECWKTAPKATPQNIDLLLDGYAHLFD